MNKLRCSKCGQITSNTRPHKCFHNETKKCNLCGQFKSKDHDCNFTSFINRNKGMRSYQDVVNYFLVLDKSRGASWRGLAKSYKLDHKNLKDRVKTYERKYNQIGNN